MAKRKHDDGFKSIGVVEIRPFKIIDGLKVYDNDVVRRNLIVQKGRETLMDLMLGLTKKQLKYIRWGKGGAPSFPVGDPLEPFEVEDSDTDVKDFLLDKELNAFNRVGPTEVTFTETLICDEVDSDVNEAAMMFEDPDTKERSIFARITFPTARLTIEKGTGVELAWTFHFYSAKEII